MYRVMRTFTDYYGTPFASGEQLRFLSHSVLPYHGGHTLVFEGRTLYLQEYENRDILDAFTRYLAPAASPVAYEGAYVDDPEPGHHVVSRLPPDGVGAAVDVITLPVLDVHGRELHCEYELLDPTLDDEAAVRLIVQTILVELTDHYYRDQAGTVRFINRSSGAQRQMPYPD